MKIFSSYSFYPLLSALILSTFFPTGGSLAHRQTRPASVSREDAYRANNIGVALLEQFKHKEGAEAFKNALRIDPKLNLARINLSIALFNVPDLPAAQREAQNAAAVAPEVPQPYYVLGLIAKLQNKPDESLSSFQRVLKIEAEPYNATALYNLGQALMRAGQRDEGLKATERFRQLRERGSATTIGQNYLEQGRYAEAIASTGAEPDLVDRTIPAVYFTNATPVVLPGAHIGTGAKIRNAIVAEKTVVAPHARIGYEADADSAQFPVSENGIVIVGEYGPLVLPHARRGANVRPYPEKRPERSI